jgi:hypothetical protein
MGAACGPPLCIWGVGILGARRYEDEDRQVIRRRKTKAKSQQDSGGTKASEKPGGSALREGPQGKRPAPTVRNCDGKERNEAFHFGTSLDSRVREAIAGVLLLRGNEY